MKIDKTYMGCFGSMKTRLKPTAIVIHHTATSSPKRTREALIKKGYSTHFEVDKDGTIYQYRETDLMCSHCGSANCHSIGIDCTHLEGKEFPIEQLQAVRELVEYLCAQYNIPQVVHEQLSGVYPHRALGSTQCPDSFPMYILNASYGMSLVE